MKLKDEIPSGGTCRKIAFNCSDWHYPWTKEQAIQEYNQYEKDMIY